MASVIDESGMRYKRLLVIRRAPMASRPPSYSTAAAWLCRCDCGNEIITLGIYLRAGLIGSCGCLYDETRLTAGKKNRRHGDSKTALYRIWHRMMQRCYDKNCPDYMAYGGRGIRVHPRWRKYENFKADMSPRPSPKHSLGRNHPDADYGPDTTKWETALEQGRNKRNNVYLDFRGERLTKAEFIRKYDLTWSLLNKRLKAKWSLDRIVSTPRKRPGAKAPSLGKEPEDEVTG